MRACETHHLHSSDGGNTLFDEALDVLPKHWRGEPFSYAGQHFSAREVIARPRPPQQPIPIWIGGNSKLTRRRVAQGADGWMPMLGPDWLFATARTATMSAGDELAAAIAQLRADAGQRGAALDVSAAYTEPSLYDADPRLGQAPGRHRLARGGGRDLGDRAREGGYARFLRSVPGAVRQGSRSTRCLRRCCRLRSGPRTGRT